MPNNTSKRRRASCSNWLDGSKSGASVRCSTTTPPSWRAPPADLPEETRAFGIVTIDVSFISLRHVLPVVPALLGRGADVVALVKPQFESQREEVGKGGIVRDAAVHARVIEEVTAAADALGLTRAGLVESPITGMEGNREFLLHLTPRPA